MSRNETNKNKPTDPENLFPEKSSEVHAEMMSVTPTMAMNWLSAVPEYQRKVDEKQVNKLIMAIQRNEWRVNGAAIVFNEKGDLIEGQHRLEAIAKAGRTVQSLVVTGVGKDEMTFASLGDVKPRKAADFIYTKNATMVAAVIRLLWFCENRLLFSGLKARGSETANFISSPPVGELVKLAKKHAQTISEMVIPLKDSTRITRTGAWTVFLMYYFHLYRPPDEAIKASEFFGRLGDGIGLEKNSPILLLRKRMEGQAQQGLLELPRKVREALVLKALNFFLDGVQIDRLTWNPDREPFPPLRGYESEEIRRDQKSVKKEGEEKSPPSVMTEKGVHAQ